MNVPNDLKYTKDHEWIRVEDEIATIGITDHAQEELTDVVFVELPEVGQTFSQGETVVVVESVKAASDTYAPVSGEVTEVNEELDADPSLINIDPYGSGWIYKMRIESEGDIESLMSAEGYENFVS